MYISFGYRIYLGLDKRVLFLIRSKLYLQIKIQQSLVYRADRSSWLNATFPYPISHILISHIRKAVCRKDNVDAEL